MDMLRGANNFREAHAPSRAPIGASPMGEADRGVRCKEDHLRQGRYPGRLGAVNPVLTTVKRPRPTAIGEGADRYTRGACAPRKSSCAPSPEPERRALLRIRCRFAPGPSNARRSELQLPNAAKLVVSRSSPHRFVVIDSA